MNIEIGVFILVVVGIMLISKATQTKDDIDIQERLKGLDGMGSSKPKNLSEQELEKPFLERVVRPIVNRIGGVFSKKPEGKKQRQSLQEKLNRAGNPGGVTAQEFIAIRMLILLLFPGFFVLMGVFLKMKAPMIIMTFAFTAGFAVIAPNVWLDQTIKKRQKMAQKQLADVLDLLTVSVEAGLGFDQGLNKVVEKMHGVLPDEFAIMLAEARMGKSRKRALKSMAERLEVDDVSSFISAIIQAETLGVGISNVLRVQSDQVRTKRRQRAEEQAMKAPIKMMLPLVGCIFPAILIVLLGSAAYRFIGAFAGK